jgi:hypothetical protein
MGRRAQEMKRRKILLATLLRRNVLSIFMAKK